MEDRFKSRGKSLASRTWGNSRMMRSYLGVQTRVSDAQSACSDRSGGLEGSRGRLIAYIL